MSKRIPIKRPKTPKDEYPLVSIIMPVYNSETFLLEATDSIRFQTYKNWELICVDDGSTDKSYDILKKFSEIDSRIKVIKISKNRGLPYALNKALRIAKGRYIARMDSDDVSLPTRIEEQVKFLNKNPNVIVVGAQCDLIDDSGRVFGRKMFPTESSDLYKMMFEMMPIQHPVMMARARVFKKVKYENLSTAEDVGLFFKLLQFGDFANIDKVLFQYRVRRTSNSLKNVKKTFLITIKTRFRAIKEWSYRPAVSSVLLNLVQFLIVSLLPSYVVLAIYESVRFSKPLGKVVREDILVPALSRVGLDFLFK